MKVSWFAFVVAGAVIAPAIVIAQPEQGDRVHGSALLADGTRITIQAADGRPSRILIDDPVLGRLTVTPSCIAASGNTARVAGHIDLGNGNVLGVVVDVTQVDRSIGSDLARYIRGENVFFICTPAPLGQTPVEHGNFIVEDDGIGDPV